VWRPEALTDWDFDAVLLAEIEQTARHREELKHQRVPDEKVFVLVPAA
jgi:hypothetical protein